MGYSHNETRNIEGVVDDFYSGPGQTPGGQGPQDQVNVWATYTINNGTLRSLGFGLGGNYAGEYKVVDNRLTGDFNLPSYIVLNASVYYNPGKFRLALNVNNFLNQEYYIGYWSVNPQKPRNAVLSLAYRF
jgi:iron complex outermembrane receptor protein